MQSKDLASASSKSNRKTCACTLYQQHAKPGILPGMHLSKSEETHIEGILKSFLYFQNGKIVFAPGIEPPAAVHLICVL